MSDYDLADPRAFESAYREHRAKALSAALGVLRDHASAEDVVQEVFAHLWRRPRSFDARRGSLRSYVTMLARSRALDRWRSGSARDAAEERLRAAAAPATVEGPEERVIERDRAARMASSLGTLPRSQREAVLLAFGADMSAPQIAAAVGVPLGTAKSRVRLGVEKMREALPARG